MDNYLLGQRRYKSNIIIPANSLTSNQFIWAPLNLICFLVFLLVQYFRSYFCLIWRLESANVIAWTTKTSKQLPITANDLNLFGLGDPIGSLLVFLIVQYFLLDPKVRIGFAWKIRQWPPGIDLNFSGLGWTYWQSSVFLLVQYFLLLFDLNPQLRPFKRPVLFFAQKVVSNVNGRM